MPGLRMGYVVSEADLAGQLPGVLPAWPLSAPAIAAAVAGFGDPSHVAAGAHLGHLHVAQLAEALAATGAVPMPSDANYLVAHAPGAAPVLLRGGIAVRDSTSFGLPGHVRLAAPKPGEMKAVLTAIAGLAATTDGLTRQA